MMKFRVLIVLFFFLSPSYGQTTLSKTEVIEDIDSLIHYMEAAHPNVYKYQSKEKSLMKKDLFLEKISDSISLKDFYLWGQSFVESFQDTHLWLYYEAKQQAKQSATTSTEAISFNSVSYKIISDSIAYLKIKSFKEGGGHRAYLNQEYQKAFLHFKEKNCKKLIIDLEPNYGGSMYCLQDLMNYLTDSKYQLVEQYWVKQSKYSLKRKKKYNSWLLWNLSPLSKKGRAWVNGKAGKVYHFKNWKNEKPKKNNLRFEGEVYAIAGKQTKSAGTTLIAALKYNHIAEIWGQATADNSYYCGGAIRFELPNSKILLGVPIECQKNSGTEKDDQPIQPDVFINNKKVVLEELLNYIKARELKPSHVL